MPSVITRPKVTAADMLELTTGLFAVSAGVLWAWVYMITETAPELCTTTPRLLAHCPLCYPAAFATLAALIGGGLLLRQRLAS
jgi:hypothetical protein